MRFKVIVAVRNAERWIGRSLESIRSQRYGDVDVFVVDDASEDRTAELAATVCKKEGWGFRANAERLYALRNQVEGIRAMYTDDPMDVIVFVDGDDYLPHDHVLDTIAKHYADDTMVAYGQYQSAPFSPTCSPSQPYPAHVVRAGTYRSFAARGGGILHNHIRTFRYEVFNQLTHDDFVDDHGEWLRAAPDGALMFPCLELARGRVKVMPEVNYVYNSENNLSEWRVWPRQVDAAHDCILRKPPKV